MGHDGGMDDERLSDPLSDVLRHVRVEGALFSRAEGTCPWGVHTRGAPGGIFHVVLRGSGVATALDGDVPLVTEPFSAGDLLVFPHGHAHALRDAPATTTTWIRALPSRAGEDGLPVVSAGGGGADCEILCGTLRFGQDARELLLPQLPPLLHARGQALGGWLDATVRQLAHEVARRAPGCDVVIARLAEILFVQAVRAWVTTEQAAAPGWVRALQDPALARALALLHGAPERAWSIDHLARRAGLSRTVFYDRFAGAVGEPPAAYLLRWRMTLARRALEDPRAAIPEVATRVGYGSEAAFNRAFRRFVGVPPGAWRRGRVAVG
jgi:AraC-like DNA-binding protein